MSAAVGRGEYRAVRSLTYRSPDIVAVGLMTRKSRNPTLSGNCMPAGSGATISRHPL